MVEVFHTTSLLSDSLSGIRLFILFLKGGCGANPHHFGEHFGALNPILIHKEKIYMSEKCCLQNKKIHKDCKYPKQSEALTPCMLFAHKRLSGGSEPILTIQQICVWCCMQSAKVLQLRNDLIMRRVISIEDEYGNPDMMIQFLEDKNLVPLAEEMLKSMGSFGEAQRECEQCAARAYSAAINKSAPPMKVDRKIKPITYVG